MLLVDELFFSNGEPSHSEYDDGRMLIRTAQTRAAWQIAALRACLHQQRGPSVNAVRLSKFYMPTVRPEAIGNEHVDSVAFLLRGGYVRQSSSGLFTLLPLGLRVIKKVEAIIDEEMQRINASRLEMPGLLSSKLWHKSGRFDTIGQELFKVKDRRETEFVLAPTCEEEVTKLVGEEVRGWRDLPVRVYQVTTKYRDEPRPKSGLLRTKSFLMKDLYTFDSDTVQAQLTYKSVKSAYTSTMNRLFGAQGREWFSVEADTGAMGGSFSHEYQAPDPLGEDEILKCDSCSYAANVEMSKSAVHYENLVSDSEDTSIILFGNQDPQQTQCTLYAVMLRKGRQINTLKLKSLIEDPEAQMINPEQKHNAWDWKDRPEGPMMRFDKLKIMLDEECKALEESEMQDALLRLFDIYGSPSGQATDKKDMRRGDAPQLRDFFPHESAIIICTSADIRLVDHGDRCPECSKGTLSKTKSVEVGHTFLLGTKYSESLGYTFTARNQQEEHLQMGCYGIGISRILGVLAQIASRTFQIANVSIRSSEKGKTGFAWSQATAPFRALILLQRHDDEAQISAANTIIASLLQGGYGNQTGGENEIEPFSPSDIAIDDRDIRFGEKLHGADLIGSPLKFIIGKDLAKNGNVEVRSIVDGRTVVQHHPLALFQQ